MKLTLPFSPPARAPRPKSWSVIFPSKTGFCTGIYKTKREAMDAMAREGGRNLRPLY